MSERKWTPNQINAINAQNGTLLVSAAAGSGKTAVLVERVIKKITNEKNPCDVDRLLIVTFTKAAASEMKERINSAISKMRKLRPFDTSLLRQQMLLSRAKICTIDSFCNDIVKENFHELGIAPDYKILDSAELCVLEELALDETIDEMYARNDDGFHKLVELMCSNKSDEPLLHAIKRLNTYTMAYPFPKIWLNKMLNMYDESIPASDSFWGRIILEYLYSLIEFSIQSLTEAVSMMGEDEKVYEAYSENFLEAIQNLNTIKEICLQKKWDELVDAISNFSFSRLKLLRGYNENPLKISVIARRDEIKDLFKKVKVFFCIYEDEHMEDMIALKPIVKSLCECVLRYSEILTDIKNKKKVLYFSDIEHLAIKLLIKEDGNSFVRTQRAEELSKKYDEILIDEYQDTNEAQDMLFRAVSNNENNMFFVGDVKQSIYRFRQAMPEIFLKRREALPFFENENYPARINLDKNFRSRSGVTQAINFVFEQLMSNEVGELEYNENEKLVCGSEYVSVETPDYEVHILDAGEKERFQSNNEFEAIHIANTINTMIRSGKKISANGQLRDLKYSDICIMLRSANAHAENYVKVLKEYSIPASAELKGGFFQEREVTFILSYLRIIDNPLQDVYFTAVMFSPVYGFTADDLTIIRATNKKMSMYSSVKSLAENGDERCIEFIEKLEKLRTISCLISCEELIRKIYEITSYRILVLSMDDSQKKIANLDLILQYANTFESTGYKGLSGFIRFIDSMQRQQTDIASASAIGDNLQSVRIMSIHHSKGLEFPVCILAGCGSRFNTSSRQGNMLLNPRYGIGLKRQDEDTLRRFNTIGYEAIKLETERAEISEELRVLYVAMTRAKECLITVMTIDKPEERLATLASGISQTQTYAPFAVRRAKGYYDWILMCAIRHPDGGVLRNLAGVERDISLNADFRMKIVLKNANDLCEINRDEDKEESSNINIDIMNRLDYTYPYAELRNIEAKRAASEIEENGGISWDYFASAIPAFMRENSLTAAQRGTALHKFMQFANYKLAKENAKNEFEKVLAKGWISQQEANAINIDKVKKFFSSELADRIFKAEKVYREYKFTIFISADKIREDLPENCKNEKVLVQGIADCVFIEQGKAVIVDYKTDYVEQKDELIEKYATQINIYRIALAQMLSIEVKECLLYSFSLNDSIVVSE